MGLDLKYIQVTNSKKKPTRIMILALLKPFITFKPFNIGYLENFVFAREEEHIIFNVQLNLFSNFFENCARVFNYCKTETKSDQSIFQFLLIKKLC